MDLNRHETSLSGETTKTVNSFCISLVLSDAMFPGQIPINGEWMLQTNLQGPNFQELHFPLSKLVFSADRKGQNSQFNEHQ